MIGYLCLRVQVELIEALEAVPLRIAPRDGFDIYDFGGIRPDGCSFCRMLPSLLKEWHYPNLRAVIGGACCDQMRRLTDTLRSRLGIPIILFGAPRTWDTEGDYFFSEMMRAFEELADIIGNSIDVSKIESAISARNRLKGKVSEMRTQGIISASLLHRLAASPCHPEMLMEFLEGLNQSPVNNGDNIRLMLAGSIPGIWETAAIEERNAVITADVTCLGDRAFHSIVAKTDNPLKALYRAYVEENLCPHRRPIHPLIDYIRELAASRKIDGIVYLTLKYCHPWDLNAKRMKTEFAEYPFLQVDDDFTSPAVGSFRTRVGAFVEMLKHRKRAEAAL